MDRLLLLLLLLVIENAGCIFCFWILWLNYINFIWYSDIHRRRCLSGFQFRWTIVRKWLNWYPECRRFFRPCSWPNGWREENGFLYGFEVAFAWTERVIFNWAKTHPSNAPIPSSKQHRSLVAIKLPLIPFNRRHSMWTISIHWPSKHQHRTARRKTGRDD